MDTREQELDGSESLPTLAALLSALRNHAAATGRSRLAHLCSAGLHAGDFAAVARVVAAIDGIDTSPTGMPHDDGDSIDDTLTIAARE
jgi:hypothetical protein